MKTKMVITTTPTSYSELYTSGRVAGYERVPPNTGRVFGYNTELGDDWSGVQRYSELLVMRKVSVGPLVTGP